MQGAAVVRALDGIPEDLANAGCIGAHHWSHASGQETGALLQWRTGLEVDNLGFNVYRQEAGKMVRLNRDLISGSALFAGASRAYITSIIFAIETSGQSHALLPLLATCSAAYIVSFLLYMQAVVGKEMAYAVVDNIK